MKKTVAVTAALLVGAGVLAAYFWLQLRTERQRGSELMARVEALEAAAPSTVQAPATSPQAAASSAQAPRNAAADGASSPIAAMLGAMQTPGGREATRAMMRGAMAQLYPDIEQELGLTAEEKERLFDIIVRHEEGMSSDALAMMAGEGRDPAATRELQRKLAETQAAQERELTGLLGSKYPKWEEYKSESQARVQLGQLRQVVAASGNPLSEAQEKALVKAFAAEMARNEKEERQWMIAAADSPDMMQESMQRAVKMQRNLLDLAKPHLNDAQLTHYRRQAEQQEKMLQSMMGMFGGTGNRP
jgi:hypothetical protein